MARDVSRLTPELGVSTSWRGVLYGNGAFEKKKDKISSQGIILNKVVCDVNNHNCGN